MHVFLHSFVQVHNLSYSQEFSINRESPIDNLLFSNFKFISVVINNEVPKFIKMKFQVVDWCIVFFNFSFPCFSFVKNILFFYFDFFVNLFALFNIPLNLYILFEKLIIIQLKFHIILFIKSFIFFGLAILMSFVEFFADVILAGFEFSVSLVISIFDVN